MASEATSSPPVSGASTPSKRRRSPPASIDLSMIPPLVQPSPPSNTLLITNLQDPAIFSAPSLQDIRSLIDASASIHSWSPLKSFRRIVVSFYTTDDAVRIRKILDGENIMGSRIRIYFGEETSVKPVDQHLQAPQSDKLFFISPPPSPPHGWEMRNEEPPNKQVHAEDLATALQRLRARPSGMDPISPNSPVDGEADDSEQGSSKRLKGESSNMIYHPEDHGHSPNLPAIAVEDVSDSPDNWSPMEPTMEGKIIHTARPPVELMLDS